jgi:flagellar hook-length control protein FliK
MEMQTIKTDAIKVLGSKTSKTSYSKAKSTNADFGNVMDNSLKAKSTGTKDKDSVKDTGKEPVADKPVTDDKPEVSDVKPKAESAGKDVNDNTNTVKASDDKINTQDTQVNAADDNADDITGINKNLEDLLALLQNTIMNNLGITKEELDKTMENLGFTTADLLNSDNLKQLVLQVNGTDDITKVLTDENLADKMNQLLQAVEDLKTGQDTGLTKEEIAEIMQKLNQPEPKAMNQEPLKTAESLPVQNLKDDDNVLTDKQDSIKIEVYKTTDDKTQNNMLQNSDESEKDSGKKEPDIKTQSPADMFVQNLAVKGNENSLNFTEQIANVRQMQNITNQIVEQIKIVIKPEQTSMEIQLNPESLGKINLSVIAKDGIMTAHFTAQNELAKEAIESQIQVLKDNLNNQGLKVESIEVTVSDFSFEQSNQAAGEDGKGQQGRSKNRTISLEEANGYAETKDETEDIGLVSSQSGNSIDYTA